jgi:3-(3-hydroxy-phenyl)propionate hydroxylase
VIPRIRAMLDSQGFRRTSSSSSNGSASTPSSAGAWSDFRHGRVLFVGDAAHQVSPFGARGANSGVQDADNLAVEARRGATAWRRALLDSYDTERVRRPTRTS